MRVTALVAHRNAGEPVKKGETYTLDDELAVRAIAEGWVEKADAKPVASAEKKK